MRSPKQGKASNPRWNGVTSVRWSAPTGFLRLSVRHAGLSAARPTTRTTGTPNTASALNSTELPTTRPSRRGGIGIGTTSTSRSTMRARFVSPWLTSPSAPATAPPWWPPRCAATAGKVSRTPVADRVARSAGPDSGSNATPQGGYRSIIITDLDVHDREGGGWQGYRRGSDRYVRIGGGKQGWSSVRRWHEGDPDRRGAEVGRDAEPGAGDQQPAGLFVVVCPHQVQARISQFGPGAPQRE